MYVYRSDLVCEVGRISYDFGSRTGRIDVAAGQTSDMGGCIRLFLRIDADVEVIIETAEGEPDTTFTRVTGKWEMHCNRRSRRVSDLGK